MLNQLILYIEIHFFMNCVVKKIHKHGRNEDAPVSVDIFAALYLARMPS